MAVQYSGAIGAAEILFLFRSRRKENCVFLRENFLRCVFLPTDLPKWQHCTNAHAFHAGCKIILADTIPDVIFYQSNVTRVRLKLLLKQWSDIDPSILVLTNPLINECHVEPVDLRSLRETWHPYALLTLKKNIMEKQLSFYFCFKRRWKLQPEFGIHWDIFYFHIEYEVVLRILFETEIIFQNEKKILVYIQTHVSYYHYKPWDCIQDDICNTWRYIW